MGPGVAQTLTSMSAPPLQCALLSRITWDTKLVGNLHRAVQRSHPGGTDFVNHHAEGVGSCADFKLTSQIQTGSQEVSERGVLQAQVDILLRTIDQAAVAIEGRADQFHSPRCWAK